MIPPEKRGTYSASLSALLYLALLGASERSGSAPRNAEFIDSLGIKNLQIATSILTAKGAQRPTDPYGTYPVEVFRIGCEADLLSEDWLLFCDRFRRGAARGKQSAAVLSLVSVFREMADNVVCHAFESPGKPCRGLAGYHVSDQCITFSVIDDGIGFLKRLQGCRTWAHLKSDQQALDAVVSKQATSRPGESSGGGFKQLFNGLLNLNGLVVLRTGTATFTLRNHKAHWQRTEAISHPIFGSQVTLVIGRNGLTEEETVKDLS